MEKEIWKDIRGYEGLYQVSNLGRVKSLCFSTHRILKYNRTRCGYLTVALYKNGIQKRYLIHRLVAEAFIQNPLNLPEVNHKDENKENNSAENLEFCDHKYNSNYGSAIERAALKRTNGKGSIKVLQFTLDNELVKEYPSSKECGRNGFNQAAVSRCCRGKIKQYKGYKWQYEN